MRIPLFSSRDSRSAPTPRRRLSDGEKATIPKKTLTDEPDSTNVDEAYRSRRTQFRRSQTITGSSSSVFGSGAEHRAQIQSPRSAEHALRRTRRSLGSRLLAALVVSLALFGLLYQLIATVDVSLYGQTTLATGQQVTYEQLIERYLRERPLERLRFVLDTDRLEAFLQTSGANEVSSITNVAPSGLGSAHISLKMREPVASWSLAGKQVYVDASGTIFDTNFYTRPPVAIVDESGVRADALKTITSSRFLQFVGQSVGMARADGLRIKRVVIPPDTTRQVQFQLSNSTRIKLSVDRPAGEQIEDAARALRYLTSKGTQPSYVDVRVSGKAYYR